MTRAPTRVKKERDIKGGTTTASDELESILADTLTSWLERKGERDTILPRFGYRQATMLVVIHELGEDAQGPNIHEWLNKHRSWNTTAISEPQMHSILRNLAEEGYIEATEAERTGKPGRPGPALDR